MTTFSTARVESKKTPLHSLPLGDLRPTGWLLQRLERQRDGMAGHLDEFWPDVRDSAWIGGQADGWERGPYWLDGMVPLAFLLDDARLKEKVQRWVGYILDHQSADGWMGPEGSDPFADQVAGPETYDAWPRAVVLKALLQFHLATGDERVIPAALRLVRRLDEVLREYPLHDWGRARWAELAWGIHELHSLTGEDWLLDIADLVATQGYDWSEYGRSFPYPDKVPEHVLREFQRSADGVWMNDGFLGTHGVNVAMGVKAPAVRWLTSRDDAERDAFGRLLKHLDDRHGQATGVFTSDEHLAGRHPSQGTEACTVVEYLFSLESVLQIWGPDESVLERWERIAFNALPASATADEWAHQYDQQANQVIAHVTEDRIYTNNGPDANVFGLEPHFGCCTANRHQGWPKFAARLWMANEIGGLTALSYAPCEVDTVLAGGRIRLGVDGGYPFGDAVRITVTCDERVRVPLRLRIPAWALDPTLVVDGETTAVEAGTFVTLDREWIGEHVIVLNWDVQISMRTGFNDALSLERGPIVFTAAVEESWERIGGEAPHETWQVLPRSTWNRAIVTEPGGGIPVALQRREEGDDPFTPEGAPLALIARARAVPGWGLEHGAAAAPPPSPVQTSEPEEPLVLLPYGSARLRVTEMPWTRGD